MPRSTKEKSKGPKENPIKQDIDISSSAEDEIANHPVFRDSTLMPDNWKESKAAHLILRSILSEDVASEQVDYETQLEEAGISKAEVTPEFIQRTNCLIKPVIEVLRQKRRMALNAMSATKFETASLGDLTKAVDSFSKNIEFLSALERRHGKSPARETNLLSEDDKRRITDTIKGDTLGPKQA